METRETALSTLIPEAGSILGLPEPHLGAREKWLGPCAVAWSLLHAAPLAQAGRGAVGAGQGLLSWLFTCFCSRALLLQLSSGIDRRSGYTIEQVPERGCSAQKPVALRLREAFPKSPNYISVWSQPLGECPLDTDCTAFSEGLAARMSTVTSVQRPCQLCCCPQPPCTSV